MYTQSLYIAFGYHTVAASPSTSNMGYLVVEAKLSDVPDIVSTFFDAFRDDHIIRQIWHCVPQDISFAYQCRRFAKHFDNMDRDGTVYRKAVDEDTGCIIPEHLLSINLMLRMMQKARWLREMAVSSHPDP